MRIGNICKCYANINIYYNMQAYRSNGLSFILFVLSAAADASIAPCIMSLSTYVLRLMRNGSNYVVIEKKGEHKRNLFSDNSSQKCLTHSMGNVFRIKTDLKLKYRQERLKELAQYVIKEHSLRSYENSSTASFFLAFFQLFSTYALSHAVTYINISRAYIKYLEYTCKFASLFLSHNVSQFSLHYCDFNIKYR